MKSEIQYKKQDKQEGEAKQSYDWLKGYQWAKGESGNPNGRPKGKTLKEFAREYLEGLPDELKVDYLKTLPTEIVWKMAEGNPHSTEDSTVKHIIPTPIMELGKVDTKAIDGVVEPLKLGEASEVSNEAVPKP